MATYYSDEYSETLVYGPKAPNGVVHSVCATFEIGAALAADDVIKMLRLPAGCTVIDGFLRATDIDTGTETLDIDWGWAANGTEAADEDGFGNLGIWTGDSNNDFAIGNIYWSAGPKFFTNQTDIQLDVNAAAAAGGTGKIWMKLDYVF